MKKLITIIMICVLALSLCACGKSENTATPVWTIQQTVDEFGDVTENSISVIHAQFQGTFSNTATPGSDLGVDVNFAKKADYNHYVAFFDLKEYNNVNAVYTSYDTITFKMKIGDQILNLDAAGDPPNGLIHVGKEENGWHGDYIFNQLFQGNDVRCIINIGNSEYSFTLLSENFPSLCAEQGVSMAAENLTCREAVKMLLDDKGTFSFFLLDWFAEQREMFEEIDDTELKQLLNRDFLEISIGLAESAGDYYFPSWTVENYSVSEGKAQLKTEYLLYKDKNTIAANINAGNNLPAYQEYRGTKQGSTPVLDCSLQNGILTCGGSQYQCRRIVGNLLIKYRYTNGEFQASSLLIPCSGESRSAILNAVTSANALLPQITF